MGLRVDNIMSFIGQFLSGGTTGSVLFVGANKEVAQDNASFFWDDSNNRLGIGTATPVGPLEIKSSAAFLQITRNASTTDYIELGTATSAAQFGANVGAGDSVIKKASGGTQTILFLFGSTGIEKARLNSNGQLGIGNTGGFAPDASAIIEMQATNAGFLPPRMTTTQKNAISSPATGLMVYDTTLNKLSVYTGAAWETVTSI